MLPNVKVPSWPNQDWTLEWMTLRIYISMQLQNHLYLKMYLLHYQMFQISTVCNSLHHTIPKTFEILANEMNCSGCLVGCTCISVLVTYHAFLHNLRIKGLWTCGKDLNFVSLWLLLDEAPHLLNPLME